MYIYTIYIYVCDLFCIYAHLKSTNLFNKSNVYFSGKNILYTTDRLLHILEERLCSDNCAPNYGQLNSILIGEYFLSDHWRKCFLICKQFKSFCYFGFAVVYLLVYKTKFIYARQKGKNRMIITRN